MVLRVYLRQISRNQLAEINYDPNWRGLLNLGKNVTVEQLILKCGAKDAEFDYYRPSQSSTHNVKLKAKLLLPIIPCLH
ncbi:hypothetical protein L218DRAFT_999231 [Marasmius fiardii PR-910]|nr:hypothetical protein L218DRAFT_999231 [Marasmius fiardii PR-910]